MLAAMNYVEVLKSASAVELAVLVLLAAASAYSWALIAMKWNQLRKARAQSVAFLDVFWKASRLDAIYAESQKLEASPLSRVFRARFTGDPQKRVLLWAMDEAVSIIGLILFFLGGPMTAWLPLMVAGFILLVLDAPSRLPGAPA